MIRKKLARGTKSAPPTGGGGADGGFTFNNEFNASAQRSVLCSNRFICYKLFQDDSEETNKIYEDTWKAAGIASGVLTGTAVVAVVTVGAVYVAAAVNSARILKIAMVKRVGGNAFSIAFLVNNAVADIRGENSIRDAVGEDVYDFVQNSMYFYSAETFFIGMSMMRASVINMVEGDSQAIDNALPNVENATIIPYWGCISNKVLSRQYGKFIEGNIPTTVQWMNYWSEDIICTTGMEKIEKIVEGNQKTPIYFMRDFHCGSPFLLLFPIIRHKLCSTVKIVAQFIELCKIIPK